MYNYYETSFKTLFYAEINYYNKEIRVAGTRLN